MTGDPSSLDGFTISQAITTGQVGGSRISVIEPGALHIPNLTLHYWASDTASVADLQDWFQSFVLQGNSVSSNEFPVTVSLASGAKVFAFGPAGISRLDPEERASDSAYRGGRPAGRRGHPCTRPPLRARARTRAPRAARGA